MRDESDAVMAALEETFRIGRELACRWSCRTTRCSGRANFGRSVETLDLIRRTMQHQCVAWTATPTPPARR
jgi:N-acyl-D-amino-acid deacylase